MNLVKKIKILKKAISQIGVERTNYSGLKKDAKLNCWEYCEDSCASCERTEINKAIDYICSKIPFGETVTFENLLNFTQIESK